MRATLALNGLIEIVRHSSAHAFSQILNRIREGSSTNDDIRKTKYLANRDTSHWLNDFVKVYLTNCVTHCFC